MPYKYWLKSQLFNTNELWVENCLETHFSINKQTELCLFL